MAKVFWMLLLLGFFFCFCGSGGGIGENGFPSVLSLRDLAHMPNFIIV